MLKVRVPKIATFLCTLVNFVTSFKVSPLFAQVKLPHFSNMKTSFTWFQSFFYDSSILNLFCKLQKFSDYVHAYNKLLYDQKKVSYVFPSLHFFFFCSCLCFIIKQRFFYVSHLKCLVFLNFFLNFECVREILTTTAAFFDNFHYFGYERKLSLHRHTVETRCLHRMPCLSRCTF